MAAPYIPRLFISVFTYLRLTSVLIWFVRTAVILPEKLSLRLNKWFKFKNACFETCTKSRLASRCRKWLSGSLDWMRCAVVLTRSCPCWTSAIIISAVFTIISCSLVFNGIIVGCAVWNWSIYSIKACTGSPSWDALTSTSIWDGASCSSRSNWLWTTLTTLPLIKLYRRHCNCCRQTGISTSNKQLTKI